MDLLKIPNDEVIRQLAKDFSSATPVPHISLDAMLVLEPHTDFHIYQRLNLYRRVNLILYLNDDWTKGDGGELRLWKKSDQTKDRPEIEIEPIGGKMVIFETSDQSVHGFTNPVRNERRSIAIYYYTSEDSSVFSGDYTTHWNVEMQKRD